MTPSTCKPSAPSSNPVTAGGRPAGLPQKKEGIALPREAEPRSTKQRSHTDTHQHAESKHGTANPQACARTHKDRVWLLPNSFFLFIDDVCFPRHSFPVFLFVFIRVHRQTLHSVDATVETTRSLSVATAQEKRASGGYPFRGITKLARGAGHHPLHRQSRLHLREVALLCIICPSRQPKTQMLFLLLEPAQVNQAFDD